MSRRHLNPRQRAQILEVARKNNWPAMPDRISAEEILKRACESYIKGMISRPVMEIFQATEVCPSTGGVTPESIEL